MRIYRQYLWLNCKVDCRGNPTNIYDKTISWIMVEIHNKYILNFIFGWHLKENTKVSATPKSYLRWFKERIKNI